MAKLISSDSRQPSLGYSLSETTTIGRDPRNDICIPDDGVSRFHAEVSQLRDDFYILDLGSSNGTYLNGKRVKREKLNQGDEIKIGDSRFVFQYESSTSDASAKTQFRAFTREILSENLRSIKARNIERFDAFVSLCEICAKADENLSFVSDFQKGMLRLFDADFAAVLIVKDDSTEAFDDSATNFTPKADISLIPTSVLEIVRKGESVLMRDPSSESRFANRMSIIGKQIGSAIAVPLKLDQQQGLLYAHRLDSSPRFEEDDLRLLFALSAPVAAAFDSATRIRRVVSERDSLRKAVRSSSMLIGSHPKIEEVRVLISKLARVNSTVLITGATGTGKELVARSLHDLSDRASGAFEAVNCAAISETLVESELFGHEKGAFTGADESRAGAFEVADGGTLFLDEIGELSPKIQAKLLRVLENSELKRVGGNAVKKVNVRVLAATNRDLSKLVEKGEYRSDLYFRINVMSVHLPELNERLSDIEELSLHFLHALGYRSKSHWLEINPEAIFKLKTYMWPGNVRELRNVLERAAILCDGSEIKAEDIVLGSFGQPENRQQDGIKDSEFASLADLEKSHILRALKLSDGNKSKAAEILGIDRSTLYAKLKGYGINP